MPGGLSSHMQSVSLPFLLLIGMQIGLALPGWPCMPGGLHKPF